MIPITRDNLSEICSTPVRFLFKRPDASLLRLFWFEYRNEDFYFGTSLNPIVSACKSDMQDLRFTEPNKYAAFIQDSEPLKKYNSLKLSFHCSGVRHLKMKDVTDNTDVELYREKYHQLDMLQQPEHLFSIITKRILLYDAYRKAPTQGKTNAVILDTPSQYLENRQIFEFYICPKQDHAVPQFIIKDEQPFDNLTFKLKDNLYLYMRFIINSEDNGLNKNFTDREILCFRDNQTLKSFSFR